MSQALVPTELVAQFRQVLQECQDLYDSAAQQCVDAHPELLAGQDPQQFRDKMLDLHRGLLVKVFLSMARADWRWSDAEQLLAREFFDHVWGRRLDAEQVRVALRHLVSQQDKITWRSVLRPFEQLPPLQPRVAELETLVTRMANLVAKSDGQLHPAEQGQLREIQHQLETHLRPVPLAEGRSHEAVRSAGQHAVRRLQTDAQRVRREVERGAPSSIAPSSIAPSSPPACAEPSREERLQEALRDLDALIGLSQVKHEVRTLTNFLRLQEARQRQSLPTTSVSLHMVFTGNPGTGKTTVARIVGRIYGALGILAKGHVIETDRSGLVAKYAGQTGPKTHQRIDEALDGVLFIDEAYSLIAERGDDPYGHEAVQALLKRMEDDRHRLVVILAGYPEPMERLLRSNPGLSSRFSRRLHFPDYSPCELGQIFDTYCEKNHYELSPAVRAKLLLGFAYLVDRRDEHFGNGRLVRNIFEASIRHLANRIVNITPLTRELLTTFAPEDIDLPGVPAARLEGFDDPQRLFHVRCPQCHKRAKLQQQFLGRRVQCQSCQHAFSANWGDPLDRAPGV
jgi:hypothetical protein